jgi:hypothetical protein
VSREPAPGQRKLRVARGQQLRALRALRLPLLITKTDEGEELQEPRKRRQRRDPTAKHLLRALDDHIGEDWQDRWFTIPVEQLADECEIGRAAAAEALDRLDEAGYIKWDRRQGRPARFKICWQVIFRATDPEADGCPSDGEGVRATDFGCPSEGEEIRRTDFLYKEEAPLSAQESAIEAPPPPPPSPSRVDQVEEAVARTGLAKAGEAVHLARERGFPDSTIMAIVDYYRSQPKRWGLGALYKRLTEYGTATTPANEAWPLDSPEWLAEQQRQRADQAREALEARQRAEDAEHHRKMADRYRSRSPPAPAS